jgi:AmmeMemoRadiSam system protein B
MVEGLFYPGEKTEMEEQLRAFGLNGRAGGSASAIIAPHGAWELSGAVAGRAFNAASGRRGRAGRGLSYVALLGNLHNPAEEGIFLSDSDYFETPLGTLPVARRLCEDLASCSTLFEINDIPHLREHTLEVLLPFVKGCFPQVSIIPILMGSSRPALVSTLARALYLVFEPLLEDTLLVVSANLSVNPDEEASRTQAEECVRLLETGEPLGPELYDGRLSVCGGAALAALLESGLLAGKPGKLVSGPLVQTKGEGSKTVYYGGFSFD